jgi:hypothetical protein
MKSEDGTRGPLRFGIACERSSLRGWESQCLGHLLTSPDVDVSVVISRDQAFRSVDRLDRPGLLWRSHIKRVLPGRSSTTRTDEPPALRGVPSIHERDVRVIEARKLDVILHLDQGAPPLHLARLARFGVWTFRYGKPSAITGAPRGFWEVRRGDPVTHVSLLRFSGSPDSTEILRRGAFRTHRWSHIRSVDAIDRAIADWPATLGGTIRRGISPSIEDASDPPIVESRHPGLWHRASLMLLAIPRIARMQTRSVFSFDQWHVGVIDLPIHKLLESAERPTVQWLPRPGRNRFLADPFGVCRDGRVTILMEEFNHQTQRGRLVSVQRDQDGNVSPPNCVMDPQSHVSYPFLVEWDGDVYCVPYLMPGSDGTPAVHLYRASNFPFGWTRVGTLIEGFPAQDPTVFRYEDRWWLLCSRRVPAATELHGWFADELAGPWRAHPGNPLKIDIRSARPAGTPFLHDGSLYRPAQDESRTYGGAIIVNRVLRLSPTEFREEAVSSIGPDWTPPFEDGLHTISAVGNVTLIDAKRRAFVWPSVRRQLSVRIGRAVSFATRGP